MARRPRVGTQAHEWGWEMSNWPRCRSCNCYLVSLTEGPRCFDCRSRRRVLLWVALLTIGFLFLCARARGGVVTEEFLDRVAWTESRNNPAARGKHGELGAWQIKAIAVAECNRVYGWRLSHGSVVDQVVGRAAARGYCLILENTLRARLGRQPSPSELYRSYRLGAAGFMRSIAAGPFCTPRQNPACAGRGNDFTQGADLPKSATEFGHIRVNPAAARGSVSGVIPNRQTQPLKTGTEPVVPGKCPDTLGSGATAGETATLTASVAERLKAPDSKSGVVVEPSRVRIPPVADQFGTKTAYLYNVWIQNPHYWTNTTK